MPGVTRQMNRYMRKYNKKATVIQRAYRARRARKPTVALIKRVSLAQSETKTNGFKTASTGIDMFHNKTHYVTNLLATKQGVTANPGTTEIDNRIGNEVVARGLKLQLQFITDPKHPNFNMRFYVFRYESNETPLDTNFYVGPAGAGGNQNRMLDFPDTRNVTILRSFTVQNRNVLPVDPDNKTVHNVYRDVWIPLKNRKIKYDSNDSEVPKYTTIGMCAVCFDANNTLETDIIAFWNYSTRFYYKDP